MCVCVCMYVEGGEVIKGGGGGWLVVGEFVRGWGGVCPPAVAEHSQKECQPKIYIYNRICRKHAVLSK